jgi:flagellar biogenesis protein FliO
MENHKTNRKYNFTFLEILGIIALIIIAVYILDFTLEAALDGWNNPM